MIPPLLALLVTVSPHCQEIREVRALAVAEGLDDRTLRALEAKHCMSQPQPEPRREERRGHRRWRERRSDFAPPAGATAACRDLTMMVRLATIGGSEHLATVEAERAVACTLGREREGSFSWPNGVTARYASGTWQWPSGVTAKFSSGTWQWPTGTTAKYTSGTWQYPSGVTARFSSGRWQRPNGSSIDADGLLADACRAEPEDCRETLASLERLDGDFRTLALVGLAWEAHAR